MTLMSALQSLALCLPYDEFLTSHG